MKTDAKETDIKEEVSQKKETEPEVNVQEVDLANLPNDIENV